MLSHSAFALSGRFPTNPFNTQGAASLAVGLCALRECPFRALSPQILLIAHSLPLRLLDLLPHLLLPFLLHLPCHLLLSAFNGKATVALDAFGRLEAEPRVEVTAEVLEG